MSEPTTTFEEGARAALNSAGALTVEQFTQMLDVPGNLPPIPVGAFVTMDGYYRLRELIGTHRLLFPWQYGSPLQIVVTRRWARPGEVVLIYDLRLLRSLVRFEEYQDALALARLRLCDMLSRIAEGNLHHG